MSHVPVLGNELAGPWFRVHSIVARQDADSAEHDFLDVLPAASAAASAGRPFVAGWLCRAAGAPLEFITNAALPEPDRGGSHDLPGPQPGGGRALPGAEAGNGRTLLFPPGARGGPAADWVTACEALVWAPCPGREALPLLSQPAPGQEAGGPGRFESALAAARGRPFGWLVVAEPTGLLGAEEARLRAQVTVLRQHDEERLRADTDKAIRRLAELDAFREAGLWAVRVLAGAATPDELSRLAPVLAGSAGLGHHPYRLGTALEPRSLAGALTEKAVDHEADAEVPFLATAGVLAALAGLPRAEVPGLRVLGASRFDVTSETGAGTGTPVSLGVILDAQDRPAGEFLLPLPTLNRHALVTGATGAGKSQTVRHLLTGLTRAGLPWLAIEPVKAEYPGMAGRLAGLGPAGAVTVLNPADPEAIGVSVSPLAPERGYPVQAHIDMVRALFLAAFDADEPFPQIIAQALQRVYEANGWDVVTGGPLPGAAAGPAVPTLAQLQREALEVIGEVGYGRELQADVRGFVDVRLRSLRIGSAGRFFEGGHPADIAGLLRRNVVLCLEDIANDEDKWFLRFCDKGCRAPLLSGYGHERGVAMARVLGAVRLSKMRDESTSPERQREQIHAWAKLYGHQVVHITEDPDVSGSVPAVLRPALGPWLTNPSLTSRWDILCTAKLDRLSRSVSDLCDLIEYARVHGKSFASVAEQFDLSTAAGRMVTTILASVAEFERERGGERRQEATEALYKAGRWPGGRFPFGYKAEKNGSGWYLVRDPETAPIVEWMAQQVISGRAATAVARDLSERGVPTPAGGRDWRTEVVIGNLRNPGLTGQVIWKGEPVRDADGEIVRHEAILDEATFAAVQTALDAGKQRRNGRRENASLLLRVAYCGRCEEPLYRSMRKRGNRVYTYYACAARLASGGRKCEEPYFGVEALEQFVSDIVLDYCGDVPRRIKQVTPAEDHTAERASVTEAISAMQTKLIESKISPELFADTIAKLEARKAKLEAQPSRPERVEWVKTGETFGKWWADQDEDGRHRYLIEAGVTVTAKHLGRGEERIVPGGTFERMGHRVIKGSHELGFLATVNLGELEVLYDLAGRHGAPSQS